MKAFVKENRRLLLIGLLALLAGTAIGLLIGLSVGKTQEDAQEARIGDGTRMIRAVHFDACAHETDIVMDASAYIGYTRAELAAHFPDASIIRFGEGEVRLMQVNTGYCPKHYILRLRDDGRLGVMRTDEALFTEELVTLVADEAVMLLPSERNSLESGLPFNSLSEIDAYLESMGS